MGHFPRLTAAALDLTPVTPDFTQTITDTLGSLGTSADGFDAYLAATLAGLSVGGDLGSGLDGDLGLAAGILSLIDPNSLASDMASLPASFAEGASIVADANALVNAGNPAPAPTSGGGGGSPAPAPGSSNFGSQTLVAGQGANESYGNPPYQFYYPVLESDQTAADVTAVRIISGDASLISNLGTFLSTQVVVGGTTYPNRHIISMMVHPIKSGTFQYQFGVTTVRVPTERVLPGEIITTPPPTQGGGGVAVNPAGGNTGSKAA